MTTKISVGVLCGGQSTEHEVSIQSAKNVIRALDPRRYSIHVIFITRQGEWFLLDSPEVILCNEDMQSLTLPILGQRIFLNLGSPTPFVTFANGQHNPILIEVLFPVLHGVRGEDGTLQGLLEMLNIPYVGANTLSSAICMDKDIAKKLLQAAGIPVANWVVLYEHSVLNASEIITTLQLPLFVKPANAGSSVGVSKVKDSEALLEAIEMARKYDAKVIVEEYLPGREIECAVLGNEHLETSVPGEIIAHHEFYTYAAKYLDPNGASLKAPAELPLDVIEKIQTMAKQVFQILGCSGMARIDFFLAPDGQLYVNEANTIPGFTPISMYPKLWGISGLNYSALIDRLLGLAIAKFQKTHANTSSPVSITT